MGQGEMVEWNQVRKNNGPWTERSPGLVATAHWLRVYAQFSSRLSVRRVRHHGQGLYRPSPTGGPFIFSRYRLLTQRRASLVQFQSRRYQPLFLFRYHPSMSTAPRLPTVRLPPAIAGTGSEHSLQDPLVLELPHSGKFGFAWPTDTAPAPSLPSLADRHASLSSSDADSVSEHEPDTDANTGFEKFKSRRWSTGAGKKGHSEESEESDFTTPTSRLNLEHNPLDHASPPLHRLSRAFSVPLPSQIGHLKNPKRSPLPSSPPGSNSPSTQAASDMVHFHDLSLELADSVQMVIQTLLRLSPPQIFDPAKEQFSACALPIPTPSVSALFTIMKTLNFMSANMAALSTPFSSLSRDPPHRTDNGYSTISTTPFQVPQTQAHDFDIGETLQSVGDALSGMAADVPVDLVLYHGDVGMKHIAVRGDEIGLSYTLSHVS